MQRKLCCHCCTLTRQTSQSWLKIDGNAANSTLRSCGGRFLMLLLLQNIPEDEYEADRMDCLVSESTEFLIFELGAYMTMALLSVLLLLGVHCEIPVLMLPYLLMQLLLVTLLAVLHTMLALVSTGSSMGYGFLVVTICAAFIGMTSYLWVTQYNCYRQSIEKRRCTCGKASEAMRKCADSGMYHTEEKQDDYSALGAVFTMYALTMLNNENNQTQG
ncbi:uncharacterized protein LOC111862029 isoform X2 [Cryptotermes secundus]|uniref:uncharacterized protein LOC111862029 isoform X2 n=1 Tax=Cryptotermes secundus TaxID=105785 RepID=UPI000CD7B428|nr:uncharacterized protein LOC111862029 isoform X2 [Cryptotermes secundus]